MTIFNQLLRKSHLARIFFCATVMGCTMAYTAMAQGTVPNPLYEFPLDGNNVSAWTSYSAEGTPTTHAGISQGSFRSGVDRFGVTGGAVRFPVNGYITSNSLPEIPQGTDATVSFWTYVGSASDYPSGYTPYTPSLMKSRYFTLAEDAKSGGLAKVQSSALLGQERTVSVSTGSTSTTKPWYLWLYKPAMMDKAGWYHVVMVSATTYSKVYLFKPDGTMACSYNYMGNNFAKQLVIGNKAHYTGERAESANVMDDFKVWNIALTDAQVAQLHQQELPPCNSNSNSNTPCSPSVLLSTLTQSTLTPGSYYLTKNDNQCAVVQSDSLGWYHYKGTDGSTNYSPCDAVKVTLGNTSATTGSAPDTLKLNGSYISIDTGTPASFTTLTGNTQVPDYALTLSTKASGFTTYQLSSSEGVNTLVFEQEGLVSFPYQLMAVTGNNPDENNPGLSTTSRVFLGVGIAAVVAGGYVFRRYLTTAIQRVASKALNQARSCGMCRGKGGYSNP